MAYMKQLFDANFELQKNIHLWTLKVAKTCPWL